ncbi:hypothetical protein QFZ43_007282 [Streptomyces afghaniensis]|nr:hypothetical protein [Streptomyces afghaniensis]
MAVVLDDRLVVARRLPERRLDGPYGRVHYRRRLL